MYLVLRFIALQDQSPTWRWRRKKGTCLRGFWRSVADKRHEFEQQFAGGHHFLWCLSRLWTFAEWVHESVVAPQTMDQIQCLPLQRVQTCHVHVGQGSDEEVRITLQQHHQWMIDMQTAWIHSSSCVGNKKKNAIASSAASTTQDMWVRYGRC